MNMTWHHQPKTMHYHRQKPENCRLDGCYKLELIYNDGRNKKLYDKQSVSSCKNIHKKPDLIKLRKIFS